MSDLIWDLGKAKARLTGLLVWTSGDAAIRDHAIACIDSALTRLRELESGVTVSRECAEDLLDDKEIIYRSHEMKCFHLEDDKSYKELRAALSRQATPP